MKQMGTLGEAMRAQKVLPADRLEAVARRVMAAQPREKWASSLLAILNATDTIALLELMRPAMESRADEYLRSLAKAGEGEGQPFFAEQATRCTPSPDQSPKGGDAGQQARNDPPASQQPRAPYNPTVLVKLPAHRRQSLPIPERKLPVAAMSGAMATMTRCVLDTFTINGNAIRDLTPADVRAWLAKHRSNVFFVERLISGVPDNMRIGDAINDQEAERIYREAKEHADV